MRTATARKPAIGEEQSYTSRVRRHSVYVPPDYVCEAQLSDVLTEAGRAVPSRQMDFGAITSAQKDLTLFYAGDIGLLRLPCVAIVGSRKVSEPGACRTRRLARELVASGVVVISGLALGVDREAHRSAIDAGGRTIGVIGTSLNKAYPPENAKLQEEIYGNHLLISRFAPGEKTFRSSFPLRNRLMAALSDATVVMEASDTSGSLHQAAECRRLGRWLFIAKSVADDPTLKWPKSFLGQPKTAVLEKTEDVLRAISDERHS